MRLEFRQVHGFSSLGRTSGELPHGMDHRLSRVPEVVRLALTGMDMPTLAKLGLSGIVRGPCHCDPVHASLPNEGKCPAMGQNLATIDDIAM
jgi:hypothetical protein